MTAGDTDLKLGPLVDEMLGRPFAPRGRGPEAYDCLGVFLRLAAGVGLEVTDPFAGELLDLAAFAGQFLEVPLADVRPLDVLFRRTGVDLAHVSTVENSRWAVTSEHPTGVSRVRLADELRKTLRAYRLKVLLGESGEGRQ